MGKFLKITGITLLVALVAFGIFVAVNLADFGQQAVAGQPPVTEQPTGAPGQQIDQKRQISLGREKVGLSGFGAGTKRLINSLESFFGGQPSFPPTRKLENDS